jgi:hypothetical protein
MTHLRTDLAVLVVMVLTALTYPIDFVLDLLGLP